MPISDKNDLDRLNTLKAAEALCAKQDVRLTKLRRMILEILLSADGPLKAYDIIDIMRDTGKRITPATMYRTLEFLLQYGLAHRVNILNAYVPCTEAHKHKLLMFVCSACSKTEEINDPVLDNFIQNRLAKSGLSLHNGSIEIQGTCRACSTQKEQE